MYIGIKPSTNVVNNDTMNNDLKLPVTSLIRPAITVPTNTAVEYPVISRGHVNEYLLDEITVLISVGAITNQPPRIKYIIVDVRINIVYDGYNHSVTDANTVNK